MPTINLKPTHKIVANYFGELRRLEQQGLSHEGAVSPAFAALLRSCAQPLDWTLAEKHRMQRRGRDIVVDGALLDSFRMVQGVWEAKDTADDLAVEVRRKFEAGYPRDNILFQSPDRLILWQDGRQARDEHADRPEVLVEVLRQFFEYEPPAIEQWHRAAGEFKTTVPELAQGLLALIEQERRENPGFRDAFDAFAELCRKAINPNLSDNAVEEMLVQHALTERLFRTVFNNPDFIKRNVIAREIEKVMDALTSRKWSRDDFLRPLDRFYRAIEEAAAGIDDYAEMQAFMNTVYEKFFQGFSVKVADTHGIVYTPQPIVAFMVRSIEQLLQAEFGRSMSDLGVHILDPFVGTGNFIVRVLREMPKTRLPGKYAAELHCNEVMLLPYYIASMNIEHAYYELTGTYRPFEGLCLVDTFETAEPEQGAFAFFSAENTARVEQQRACDIFVILGNPPYSGHQVNENDNNKNRKYEVVDKRVSETYARDSAATNKNALSDPYVKAFRWASDRIGEEGVVALVSNGSYLTDLTFDGMREHLTRDFDAVYVLDLGGNVRKNPKLSGTTHNVFGIQVGVSIAFLVRRKADGPNGPRHGQIFYAAVETDWRKEQKYDYLDQKQDFSRIEWRELAPDARHTWLTEGLRDDFAAFLPMGTKAAKAGLDAETIFANYGRGVATSRDAWVYNFDRGALEANVRRMMATYNDHVLRWGSLTAKPPVDDFVEDDPKQIVWSDTLKHDITRGIRGEFDASRVRRAVYRPFTQQWLYFDRLLNERVYQMPAIFPTAATEAENRAIWLKVGSAWPSFALMTDKIPDVMPQGGSQCFPLYTYDEGGTIRIENITDWALRQFRDHYGDETITKRDIFHYVYAVLHHPAYRRTYAADLKRDLPRIPYTPDFHGFAAAGAALAALHVGYEAAPEYPLRQLENRDVPLNWRVAGGMRFSKDKTQLVYNDFLTLDGIPAAAFDYRLGHRSALEWVVDQYRVTTDARSGIVNDPNRPDDLQQYIVRLVGRVITVSLETQQIVAGLPGLG